MVWHDMTCTCTIYIVTTNRTWLSDPWSSQQHTCQSTRKGEGHTFATTRCPQISPTHSVWIHGWQRYSAEQSSSRWMWHLRCQRSYHICWMLWHSITLHVTVSSYYSTCIQYIHVTIIYCICTCTCLISIRELELECTYYTQGLQLPEHWQTNWMLAYSRWYSRRCSRLWRATTQSLRLE